MKIYIDEKLSVKIAVWANDQIPPYPRLVLNHSWKLNLIHIINFFMLKLIRGRGDKENGREIGTKISEDCPFRDNHKKTLIICHKMVFA